MWTDMRQAWSLRHTRFTQDARNAHTHNISRE